MTSSLTPSIEPNSWRTPLIFASETAAPGIEDKIILLRAFPKVCPKPLSRGSNTIFELFESTSSTKISLGVKKSLIISKLSVIEYPL